MADAAQTVTTDIPARLERLPFGNFHKLIIVALGVTWILDGLEVTLVGSVSGVLKESRTLALSNADIGFATSAYLLGAVLGAAFFGWLTDRLGRKKMFFITLAIYLVGTAATSLSWNIWSFSVFRFVTGAGIGGEYTAINSTIQELIPARMRGRTDLIINGSFWLGAAAGALGSIILLDSSFIDPEIGWRLAFLSGAVLGLVIIVMRLWIPESPRWLVIHGRAEEAEKIVADIERRVLPAGYVAGELKTNRLRTRRFTPIRDVLRTLFRIYRRRTVVGLILMAAQAFCYNAIFFTYALILVDFYHVPADGIGWYILPFAVGNFLGPLLLGPIFDTWGRRVMVALTYGISGVLLAGTGFLFSADVVTATQLTMAWVVVFFFASAAASSAYLTVSENFPLETRALAIAFFYSIGTAIGGVGGPWLFGKLIDTGSRASVLIGYLIGAAAMLFAAGAQWLYGINAERRSLEEVARPLAFVDD
jgi:MFS family permease